MLPKSLKEPGAGEQARNTIPSAESERFKKQIEFILEADKLKHVRRKTILLDHGRRENSAEHSWHIALMVLIMSEYSLETDIDFFHVMKMLLIHDLVEIDAGDTYCYDADGRKDQSRREHMAAQRIFGLLPDDQAEALRELWEEFEQRQTPEARFANALDRVQPLLNNYFTDGQTWQENDIKSGQVHRRMRPVKDGAPVLWNYVTALIEDAVKKEILAE